LVAALLFFERFFSSSMIFSQPPKASIFAFSSSVK
jgi:hypothetical protein